MSLLLQLMTILLILYISYNKLSRDLFSPTVLFVIGYIITTVFAIYNLQRWQSNISLIAVFAVFLGVISFFATELFWKKVRIGSNVGEDSVITEQLSAISQRKSKIKLLFAIIIAVVATIILYREITRIAYANYRDWGNLIYNYRQNRNEEQMSTIARMANYLTKAFAYVYLFCYANEITKSRKIQLKQCVMNIPLLIPGVLYSIQAILLGGRIGIIAFALAGVFLYNLLRQYKYGATLHINIGKFIKVVVAFVVICVLFFKLQEVIGRDQSKMTILDYIATYLGGSMNLFSQYIFNPKGYDIGYETFAGIISNLQNYAGILKNVKVTASHEFRSTPTGFVIGNTYTGFRNYYNDFGLLGVFLATILFATIFSGVFYAIKKTKKLSKSKIIIIIIYASEVYCVLFHFFCDYFLAGISINRLINYILIALVANFVFDKQTLHSKE